MTAGRRIFDRFGFNLPKKPQKKFQVKKLDLFKEWEYDTKSSDWLEPEGALTLINYPSSDKLITLLELSILVRKVSINP